jgi:hypothetical protein
MGLVGMQVSFSKNVPCLIFGEELSKFRRANPTPMHVCHRAQSNFGHQHVARAVIKYSKGEKKGEEKSPSS